MKDFNHLHVHSSFSFNDGLASVDSLFERAKELGMSSMSLTEHGVLASLLDGRKASLKYGVKYIPGCEFYFTSDTSNKDEKRKHLIILAKNEVGYKNLLALNYEGFKQAQYVAILNKVFPRIDYKLLEQHHEGLICTSACSNGPISKALFSEAVDGYDSPTDRAEQSLTLLKDIFGEDFYLEVQPHHLRLLATERKTGEVIVKNGQQVLISDQKILNDFLVDASKRFGVKLVATCDVHYLERSDAKYHDMLAAISDKKPLNDPTRHRYSAEEFYVKSGQEVFDFFAADYNDQVAQEVCANTLEIAGKCEEPKYLDPTGPRFPRFKVSEEKDYAEFVKYKQASLTKNVPDDHLFMRFKVLKAFKQQFGKLDPTQHQIYKERIQKEINVLEQHNFCSYMLIVSDFIKRGRENGVHFGPGRGCLSGNEWVLSENGFKQLKDLNVNDSVYTHDGQIKKIEKTFEYDIDEQLVELRSHNSFGPITLTKDHKVLGLKRTVVGTNPKLRKFAKISNEPVWIEADHLSVGDLIFTEYPKRATKMPERIDLSKYAEDMYNKHMTTDNHIIESFYTNKTDHSAKRTICRDTGVSRNGLRNIINGGPHNAKTASNIVKVKEYLSHNDIDFEAWCKEPGQLKTRAMNRYIDFDDNFAYLVGRWIGDGWIRDSNPANAIGLAFNSDDQNGMDKIESYLTSLGFECFYNRSKTKKLVQMYVFGTVLVSLFRDMFPDYKDTSGTKHLPACFRELPDNLLRSMLIGYQDSDGHISAEKDDYRESIDTTSKRLMLETKEALLYLGIKSSVSTRKPFMRGKYRCNESYKIKFHGLSTRPARSELDFGNGYFSPIMGKTYTNGVSKVYDLQVKDDHSYLTTNGVVHNSVAGSLVAYLLRIHDVNSIQYDLLFERFHNKEKKAFPDIDTDMDPVGRDWVEQYLIKKYGEKNVAHVSNLSTMTPKVTIKDIARSLELGGSKSEAFKIANRITDTIPAATALRPHVSFDDALAESKEFREACAKYPQLEEYGRKLIGLEKNYATHAAGLIIGDTDLSTFLPLRIDKNGAVAVQYEKNRCEEVGLIKMDLLVIEHLSIVADTLKNAGVLGQKCPEPKDIPLDDAAVWADVAKGRTLGVFQMGSPHMIELCKKIKPKCIEDLSLVNALGRPSAAKSRDIYIGRRDGRVPIEFKHECLRPALESTLGVGVYEEQLMKLANTVAGWDLNKADGLRKLTKLKGKNPELAERLKLEFITDACKVSKTTVNQAEEIWVDVVEPFAGYGFNACLYKDESIDVFDANGVICRRTTIGDLFDSHTEGDFVRSRDELTKEQIFVPIKGVHDNGAKEVFEFTLDTGIQVKCSMDHKFRVSDGRMLPIKQIFEEGLDIVCM